MSPAAQAVPGFARKTIQPVCQLRDGEDEIRVNPMALTPVSTSKPSSPLITVFKAVLLEGLEVAFTVLAVGAGHGLIAEASLGAAAACALVLVVGMALRRPLARVPENGLKFCVGVLLTAFGVYWSGEGLGLSWPGAELALLGLIALFAIVGLGTARLLRQVPVTRETGA